MFKYSHLVTCVAKPGAGIPVVTHGAGMLRGNTEHLRPACRVGLSMAASKSFQKEKEALGREAEDKEL